VRGCSAADATAATAPDTHHGAKRPRDDEDAGAALAPASKAPHGSWSAAEVSAWLHATGFGAYAAALAFCDGAALDTLTDKDMQELHLPTPVRRQLLIKIAELA
jgi:hypothetical protein